MNATGALIFTAFSSPRRVGDVIEQLAIETCSKPRAIRSDVLTTVDRLVGQGLLTRDGLPDVPTDELATSQPDAPIDPAGAETWHFQSGPLEAGGITFEMRAGTPEIVDDLASALIGFDASRIDTADHRVDLPSEMVERLGVGGALTEAFDRLDAIVTEQAVGIRLHGGAVERDGDVVVVLGRSGSGKSSLTAALVRAGWAYLTDEVVVIEPGSRRVHPYRRPLDLEPRTIAELGVVAVVSTGGRKDKVRADQIGTGSTGGELAGIIVLTGRAPEGDREGLVRPAEALMALLPMTFEATFGDADAEVLGELARICEAVPTLRMGRVPLDEMVEAIDHAFGRRIADGSPTLVR